MTDWDTVYRELDQCEDDDNASTSDHATNQGGGSHTSYPYSGHGPQELERHGRHTATDAGPRLRYAWHSNRHNRTQYSQGSVDTYTSQRTNTPISNLRGPIMSTKLKSVATVIRELQVLYHSAARATDVETEREARDTAGTLADAYGIPADITDHLQRMAHEHTGDTAEQFTPPVSRESASR